MPPKEYTIATTVLSVRVSDDERAILASAQARANLSDVVRRKALEAAEIDVMERRIVIIPAERLGGVRGLGQSSR